jgi:anti-anti-sigma factor
MMETQIEMFNDHLVVAIQGRLDTTQSDAFEKKMLELLETDANKIILDCKKLDYISSSGLRVLLIMLKRITAAGGEFYLSSLQPAIREIFEISGFTSIFRILDSPDVITKDNK